VFVSVEKFHETYVLSQKVHFRTLNTFVSCHLDTSFEPIGSPCFFLSGRPFPIHFPCVRTNHEHLLLFMCYAAKNCIAKYIAASIAMIRMKNFNPLNSNRTKNKITNIEIPSTIIRYSGLNRSAIPSSKNLVVMFSLRKLMD